MDKAHYMLSEIYWQELASYRQVVKVFLGYGTTIVKDEQENESSVLRDVADNLESVMRQIESRDLVSPRIDHCVLPCF